MRETCGEMTSLELSPVHWCVCCWSTPLLVIVNLTGFLVRKAKTT